MAAKLIERIALIGFGEAGGILGADLAKSGVSVTMFDILLRTEPSRAAMLAKAKNANVHASESLAEAIGDAEVMISAVTCSSAPDVARELSFALRPDQIYLDINSVPPDTKRENPPPPEEMMNMANRLKRLREQESLKNEWHIDLYCEPPDLRNLAPHIKSIPIPVVFDHMAVPAINNGVKDPDFQFFVQLLRDKTDCYAKVTCPERLTGSANQKIGARPCRLLRCWRKNSPTV